MLSLECMNIDICSNCELKLTESMSIVSTESCNLLHSFFTVIGPKEENEILAATNIIIL